MAPCRYAVSVSSVSMGHSAALVLKCHSTMSLRCVGVVGVEGPRRRVGVEGPWRRVVTPRGCHWCRWATTPCRYGALVLKGHGAAWVSKGHGAVLLRRVGVVGVVGARRCRWATAPCGCRRATTPWSKGHGAMSLCHDAVWVSMGHGATWVSKGHDAAWVSKGRDAA
ncbi:hypothetical protein EDB85DRAFT_1896214 [Lactarius pseudohatsudake]|nr:hypothetical protein EDB85DRAFT_1896214 [Lactarius pseudohatsudake]